MADFFIWTTNFAERSACSYYRIEVPMLMLDKLGYAEIYEDRGEGDEKSAIARSYSDIAHHYAIGGESPLRQMRRLRSMPPGVREGREIYPPALIYDIDDNNDFVHPFNTSFAHMGVRGYPDARLLNPNTEDGLTITDHNDKPIAKWEDGVTHYQGIVFDIARNLHQMKVRHEIIRTCHGVTVASPTLARYMKQVVGAPSVYVFPNTVVPEHYEKIRAVREDPEVVRILWQGGMSHWIDWYPLRFALKTLSEKYRGKIKWIIFGEWFNWIHENIPDDMVEHHPWVKYDAYKLKRGLLNIDINLCPLVNNVFSSCKSAIKWYESILWEKPEVTLAAKSAPYSEIVDGETGLLYTNPEEFAQKLGTLIEDATLRQKLAEGAKKWVMANRTPQATVPGLFDFYAETRARQRRDLGNPIIKKATIDEIKRIAQPIPR